MEEYAREVKRNLAERLELSKLEGGTLYRKILDSYEKTASTALVVSDASEIARLKYESISEPYQDCTSFALRLVDEELTYTYAIVFWGREQGDKEQAPNRVCFSIPLESSDGEFRGTYVLWSIVEEAYADERNSKLVTAFESAVLELIAKGRLVIEVRAHPDDREDLAEASENMRMGIKLAVRYISRLHGGGSPPHESRISQKFGETFLKVLADTGAFTDTTREISSKLSSRFVLGKGLTFINRLLGVKMIPSTLGAICSPGNIRYRSWREAWVAQKVSDLRLNGRCPGFPIIAGWFLCVGLDEDFYSGDSVKGRFWASDLAQTALRQIEEARRIIKEEPTTRAADSARALLKSLDEEFYKGVVYAEEKVVLSQYSLVLVEEWVGNTLGYSDQLHNELVKENAEVVVFESLYAAHALHEVAVHCDLHLHNLTTRIISKKPIKDVAKLYVLDGQGEKSTFVFFADSGKYSVRAHVIDYSRAVVNPKYSDEIARQFGPATAATFFSEQGRRIASVLLKWIPGFAEKHLDQIVEAGVGRQQDLYEALKPLDFFVAARNMGKSTLLDNPHCRKLCKKMEEKASELLVEFVTEVAVKRRPLPSEEVDRRCVALFRAVFRDRLFSKQDPALLRADNQTVIYNNASPLRYSSEREELLPPLHRAEMIEKLLGKPIEAFFDKGKEDFERLSVEREGEPYVNLIAERLRGELEKAPLPDSSSSWEV